MTVSVPPGVSTVNVLPGFTPVGTVKVSLEVAGIARAAIAGAWLPGRKPAVVVLEVWFPIVWCECRRIRARDRLFELASCEDAARCGGTVKADINFLRAVRLWI